MKEFNFKLNDHEGLTTLENLSSASQLNEWVFDTIKPHCEGKILEVGSGIGNVSEYFLRHGYDLTMSDIRNHYLEYLKDKFSSHNPKLLELDIGNPDLHRQFNHLTGAFDTVYSLNVVEHIEDDTVAIRNCKDFLKPGGRLIILVPAFNSLYNHFDRSLHHYRRYTRKTLIRLMNSDFEILHGQYFNAAGMLGWIVTGGIVRKKIIPRSQVDVYDKMVPVFKLVDKLLMNRLGLSVIVVGKKIQD